MIRRKWAEGIRGRNRKWSAGFSLLETILSMSLATVLLSSLFILYYGAANSAATEDKRGYANKEARLVTQRLARDFRLVGLIAPLDENGDSNDIRRDVPGQIWSDSLRNDFEYANTYSVVFTADVENDGHTETVRYFLENHQLKEKTWQWSRDSVRWLMPKIRVIASNVDALMYRYFDKDGITVPAIVTYPAGGYTLTAGERYRVTSLEVSIVIKSLEPVNGEPQMVYLPDGTYFYDKFRRIEHRMMIRPRNLSLGA